MQIDHRDVFAKYNYAMFAPYFEGLTRVVESVEWFDHCTNNVKHVVRDEPKYEAMCRMIEGVAGEIGREMLIHAGIRTGCISMITAIFEFFGVLPASIAETCVVFADIFGKNCDPDLARETIEYFLCCCNEEVWPNYDEEWLVRRFARQFGRTYAHRITDYRFNYGNMTRYGISAEEFARMRLRPSDEELVGRFYPQCFDSLKRYIAEQKWVHVDEMPKYAGCMRTHYSTPPNPKAEHFHDDTMLLTPTSVFRRCFEEIVDAQAPMPNCKQLLDAVRVADEAHGTNRYADVCGFWPKIEARHAALCRVIAEREAIKKRDTHERYLANAERERKKRHKCAVM